MGKKKKYLIKPVNLGNAGEPARILAERYLKLYGQQEFSKLIRKLIVIYLSPSKQFRDYKKDVLVFERKELNKEQKEIFEKRKNNEKELEKFNIEAGDIDAESFKD